MEDLFRIENKTQMHRLKSLFFLCQLILYSDFIQDKFDEGHNYYDKLHSLFQNSTSNNNNNKLQLKEVTELYHIMTNQCPSLQKFRKNTIRLLQNWYMNVFDEPFFVKIGFATPYHDNNLHDDEIYLHYDHVEEGIVEVHDKENELVEDEIDNLILSKPIQNKEIGMKAVTTTEIEIDDSSSSNNTHGSAPEAMENDQDHATSTSNNKTQNVQVEEGDGESEGITQDKKENEVIKVPTTNDHDEMANLDDDDDDDDDETVEYEINNDEQIHPSNNGEDNDEETEEEEDFRLLQTQEIPDGNEFQDSEQTIPDEKNEDNLDKEVHREKRQKTRRLRDEYNGAATDQQNGDGHEDDTTYNTCGDGDKDDNKVVQKKSNDDSTYPVGQKNPSDQQDKDDSEKVGEDDLDNTVEDHLNPNNNEMVHGKRKRQKTRRYIDEFNGIANNPNHDNDNEDKSSPSDTTTRRSSPKRQRGFKSQRFIDQHSVIYSPLNNRKRTRVVFDVIECNRVTSESIEVLKEETTKRIWEQLENLLEEERKKKEDGRRKMPSNNLTFTDDDDDNENNEQLNDQGKNEEVGVDETIDQLETQEERCIEPANSVEDTITDQLEKEDERLIDENEEGIANKNTAVEDIGDSDFGQEEEVDGENDEQYDNQNEENKPTTNRRSSHDIIMIQDSSEDQLSQQHCNSQDSSVLSERNDLMNGRPQLKTPQPHHNRIEMIPILRGHQSDDNGDDDELEEAENESRQEKAIQRQRKKKSKNKKRKKSTSGDINNTMENSSTNNTNAATTASNGSNDTNDSDHDPDFRSRTTTRSKKRARTRTMWTLMEKACVKKGFQKYGRDWVKIKDLYSAVFINRTNVQIKVCMVLLSTQDMFLSLCCNVVKLSFHYSQTLSFAQDCFRSMRKRGEI